MIGLAYGLVTYWDTPSDQTLVKREASSGGTGFGLGLMIGLAAGIAIGSVLALRKRQS